MKIQGIKCNHCGDIIYSRATHDMRYCSCGKVAIDGGRDYIKINANKEDDWEAVEVELSYITQYQLYNDWNIGNEQYGIIRSKKINN